MTLTSRVVLCVLCVFVLIFASDARSQKAPAPGKPSATSTPAEAKQEKDPFARETPQGLLVGLMRALGASDYERALKFFETSNVRGSEGQPALNGSDLARQFHKILNRAGSVLTTAELSEDPHGNVTDGLPENVERFGVIKFAGREVPLLATRVERDNRKVWLVSTQTLNEIPSLARSIQGGVSIGAWIDMLPKGPTIFGAPLSHWVALLVAAALSYAFAWAAIALFGLLLRFIRRDSRETTLSRLIEVSAGPMRLLVVLLIVGIVAQALGISIVARFRVLFLLQVFSWFAVAWLLWRCSDVVTQFLLGRMPRQVQVTAYSAVTFLKHLFKASLILLFLALLLRAVGVNLTAGLAALGIGGLAVALGAQKLLENLIGSVTLIADHPMRVGDFCRIGNDMGTIEEIGIRSTRIRTLDRTALTIPNGELSSLHIENLTQRDRYWFHPTLNLRYETTADQIQSVLDSLRLMLIAHPKVEKESMRVRLVGLSTYSLDVEIFAYVFSAEYAEYLEIQEKMLLECMDIVESAGTGFAFPSQTLYLTRDIFGTEIRDRMLRKDSEGV